MLLCVCFSACSFSSTIENPPPVKKEKEIEWKEFVSEEGRFKIVFPGIPRQSFKENDTPNGKVKTTIFDLPLKGDYFEVRYGDFPAEPDVDYNNLKPYYDFIRDNTLKLQSSTLLNEQDVFLNGKLGRELVTNFNGTYIRHRLFLVGRRMYQTSTRVEISHKDNLEIQERSNKFIDSFQIMEK